ncbi:sphinganine-1-phosphate aldolase [Pichia kluyveri]|uniref:sphinganine-1-phosphate aldolase n=1 Tax=Pichia kluyveri TaxID=36015 RepID=A0AAV5R6J5_PICKL|nr:sphinganine-1-phosphate aldolase [Pichia kluyveri]
MLSHVDIEFLLEELREYIAGYYFNTSIIIKFKDFLFVYTLYKYLLCPIFQNVYGYGIYRSLTFLTTYIIKKIYSIVFKLPVIRSKIEKEIKKTQASLESQLIIKADHVNHSIIPDHGLSFKDVMNQLDELDHLKSVSWKEGKISGAVYHGGDDLIKLQTEAYHRFAVSNQLHPDAFPGVRQMESEVVSMVLNLFNASPEGCGTTSSGGTESLLLACLAARERGRVEKGITEPEIVAPKTIHAAVFKAAKYFKMKLLLADLDPKTFTVDINHVKRLITKNTVILLGSAPNFPYGTVDDIPKLSNLAVRYDIPLHVDCCLGSFVVAYYEKAMKKPFPFEFDFRLPGVTSISCDTHKYGFAPKGSSIIMYKNSDYRKYQYYISSDWVGGLYGSPTLAGSRPGALTVGAWATMIHLGDDGYTEIITDILENAKLLKHAIVNEIDELDLIGDPLLSVISFKSDVINIHALGDMMSKKYGWHLSSLQQPAALHLAVTKLTNQSILDLINDLKKCVAECVEITKREGKDSIKSDTAQLYGVAESISTSSVVDELVGCFLNVMYKTDKDNFDNE